MSIIDDAADRGTPAVDWRPRRVVRREEIAKLRAAGEAAFADGIGR